ncbi:DNA polymerase epsilon subunit 4-like [Cloeon dipterum]|uniref:DNA polymerase epsilon subunit 4-like n=1 Tax=Cloeon dipterum TaxID=197152 RepID=UPI00321FEED5
MDVDTLETDTDHIDSEHTPAMDSGELTAPNSTSENVNAQDSDNIIDMVDVEDEDLDDAMLEELLNAESEEEVDDEDDTVEDEAVEKTDENNEKQAQTTISASLSDKISRLPLSRIKQIIKLDSDVDRVNGEATFLIAKSAELFLQSFAQEIYKVTSRSKKKTIQLRDINTCIEEVMCMQFLEGCFLEQL